MVNQYGVFFNENYVLPKFYNNNFPGTWAKLALPNLRLYTKLNIFFSFNRSYRDRALNGH